MSGMYLLLSNGNEVCVGHGLHKGVAKSESDKRNALMLSCGVRCPIASVQIARRSIRLRGPTFVTPSPG